MDLFTHAQKGKKRLVIKIMFNLMVNKCLSICGYFFTINKETQYKYPYFMKFVAYSFPECPKVIVHFLNYNCTKKHIL